MISEDVINGINDNSLSQKATPEEAAEIYNNRDKIANAPSAYMSDYNLYKAEVENSRLQLNKYLDYRGLAKSLSNNNLYSVIKGHEEELKRKEDILKQRMFDESSFWNRLSSAYQTSKLSMEKSLLTKKLMDAREVGDTKSIDSLTKQIDRYNEDLSGRQYESDMSFASTFGSLGASVVEFAPELGASVAMGVAASALTPLTGGGTAPVAAANLGRAALVASRIIKLAQAPVQAGLVYNKAANIGIGTTYEELSNEYPMMSEQNKREIAEVSGRLNGAVEALGASLGVGAVANKFIYPAVAKKMFADSATKAIVKSPAFEKAFASKFVELAKASALGGASEGMEEVVQNAMTSTINEMVAKGEDVGYGNTLIGSGEDLFTTLRNLASGNATDYDIEQFKTFMYVASSSGLLSGGMAGVGMAIDNSAGKFANKKGQPKNVVDRVSEGMKNLDTAEQYMESKAESKLNKMSPDAYKEQTKILVQEGVAPENVFIDVDSALALMQLAETNDDLAVQLAGLDLQSKIDEANATDGKVAIDFETADEIIFNPENDVLYQEIKNNITFSKDTMSKAESDSYIKDIMSQMPELKADLDNKDSIINRVVERLRGNMDENEALANAILAKQVFSAVSTFSGTKTEEQFINDLVSKIQADRRTRRADAEAKKMQPKSGWFGSKKVQGYKVKQKKLDLSKLTPNDLLAGVDLPYNRSEGANVILWENKQGNYIVVKGNNAVSSAVLTGEGQDTPVTVISSKDGYTLDDALSMAQKVEEADTRAAGIESMTSLVKQLKKATTQRSKDNRISLLTMIKRLGGISAEDNLVGDVRQILDKESGKYIKNDGVGLDELTSLLWQRGYIESAERPEIGRLLELIEREARGEKVYSALDAMPEAEAERQANLQMLEEMDRAGVSLDDSPEAIYDALYRKPTITEEVSQAMDDMDIPFSKVDGTVAGYYNPEEMLLRLTKESNPTTFAHEIMHFYEDMLVRAYNSGRITDYWAKQLDSAAKWLGAKPVDGKYNFTREQKEKLAEGFTTYLATGKAPSTKFEALFDMFRDLFMRVYRTLRGMKQIKLSKEITDFYDRIFIKENEASALREQERYGAVQRPEGVSDKQWDNYLALTRRAHAQTVSSAVTETAKIAEKQATEEYKKVYDKYFEDFSEAFKEDKQLQTWDAVYELKINPESLKGKLADGVRPKNIFLNKNGMDAEVFVRQGEFESVNQLVEFLNNNESTVGTAARVAKEQADYWLKENYPELEQVDVDAASRNIATIKAQLQEAMMLRGKDLDQFGLYYANLVSSAEKTFQNMKSKDASNIDSLMNQLNTVTERYRIAERKGDMNEAGKLRYRAAVLNYMLMRAYSLRATVKRFDRHFQKYKTLIPKKAQLRVIEGEVWDMIHSALYNFRYTGRKPANSSSVSGRINDYVNKQNSETFLAKDMLLETAPFLDNASGINGKNMTVADFTTLNGALRLLESVSKRKREIQVGDRKVYIQDAVDSTVEKLDEEGRGVWNEEDTLKNFLLGDVAMKETLLSKVLPRNVFNDFVLPFMEGLTKKAQWITEKGNKLAAIIKPIMKRNNETFIIDGRSFNMEQLLVIMLNSGNEHNMKCIIQTLNEKFGGFTKEDLQSLLDQAPIELRDVAQQVWDFFEENVADFKEAQRRIMGAELKMVEPKELTFSDGQTLKGGYYPAMKKAVATGKDFSDASVMNMSSAFPSYSFQKERTLIPHGDLYLNIKPLETWVYQMSSMINVAEPYMNMYSLIQNKEFRNRLGDGGVKALQNWLVQSIRPDAVSKGLAFLDSMSSVAILGWRPIKVIIQALGFIPAMTGIGSFRVLSEVAMLMSNPFNLFTIMDKAKSCSNYMNERFSNPEKHLADIRRTGFLEGGKTKAGLEKLNTFGMYFVAYGDAMASYATWQAQYKKSLAEGMTDAQARLEADSIVRRYQGDTSAGSRPPLIQGNIRFITKFASYFIGINSLITSDIMYGSKIKAIALLAVAGVISPMAEAALSYWLEWEGADEDKRRRWAREGIYSADDLLKSKITSNIASSTGSSLLPAFGIGGTIGSALAGGKLYSSEITALTYVENFVKLGVNIKDYWTADTSIDKDKAKQKAFENVLKAAGVNVAGAKETKTLIENLARRL